MQLLSWMNAWRKNSSLTPKSGEAYKFRFLPLFVALVLKFHRWFRRKERTSTFRPKIYLADLLKIHLGVELDPQDGKSSRERETVSFCSRFNTNAPRQEADLPIKIKTLCKKNLLKSMSFWPEPRSDECHSLSLELSTLCYALITCIVPYTNQVLLLLEQLTPWTWDRLKLLQSPNFSALCLHAINPTTPIHGLMKGPRWRPAGKLKERLLRSHGETGDCEKSKEADESVLWNVKTINNPRRRTMRTKNNLVKIDRNGQQQGDDMIEGLNGGSACRLSWLLVNILLLRRLSVNLSCSFFFLVSR